MPPRTEVDKKRIEQLAAKGVKPQAIARRTGCSAAAVYSVLRTKRGAK